MDLLKRVYLQMILGIIDTVFIVLSVMIYWIWDKNGGSTLAVTSGVFGVIAAILWIGVIINASFVSKETHNNNGVIASCLLGGIGAILTASGEIKVIKEQRFEEALEKAQEKTLEAHLKFQEKIEKKSQSKKENDKKK